MSELPIGWVDTTFEDVVDYVQRGKSPKYADESELPVVNQKCVRWWGIQEEFLKFIRQDQIETYTEERFLRDGDILWNSTGTGTIGRAALFQGLKAASRAVVDGHVTILRSSSAIDPSYLFNFIRSATVQSRIEDMQTGTTNQVELSKTAILKTEIPLPPLAEQKRIVSKLNTLSARTATARAHLAAIRKLVEKYKRGIYEIHFADAGERLPLGEVAKVGTGATPKKGTPQYYDNGTVPWITSGAVNDKIVSEPSGYITETALKETNCKLFPAGSLLMAMYGEGKTRGQVARLAIEAATNQAIAVIHNIDAEKIDVDFLYRFLDSIYLEIRELAEGGVQPNLSLGKVKSFELPLPSLDKQREVVRQIESAFTKIDRLAIEAEKALKLTVGLDQQILAKAFAGKLIPQDPNDEPASVLLDRIREGRANPPKKSRPRRRRATAMKKSPENLLLADSADWPKDGLAFEDVAKRVVLNHDDLRDALFALLGGSKPKLEQVFDKTEERMRLKPVAQ